MEKLQIWQGLIKKEDNSYKFVKHFVNIVLKQIRISIKILIILLFAIGNTTVVSLQSELNKSIEFSDIVGYWNFDEGEGEEVMDSSQNNNDGILSGAEWTNEAIKGKALSFDGTDDYVRIEDSDTLSVHNGLSIELWMKADNFSGDGESSGNPLVCKWTLWTEGEFHFSSCTGGDLILYLSSGTAVATTRAYSVLDTNTWYHLVATWNGSYVKLYVNATTIATSPTYFDSLNTEEHEEDYLQIGHDTGGSSWWFDGIIDEVTIYNRELSEQEIRDNFSNLSPSIPITTVNVHMIFGFLCVAFLSLSVSKKRIILYLRKEE